MKKLFALVLIAALPLAHAAPTSSIKISKVKEWTTGDAKMSFRITPTLKKSLSTLSTYITVRTAATAQQASIDTLHTFTSTDDFLLSNGDSEPHNYWVIINTCVNKPGVHTYPDSFPAQCGHHEENITLDPKTMTDITVSPDVSVKFREPGEYELRSQLFVANIEFTPTRLSRLYGSSSVAKITVT